MSPKMKTITENVHSKPSQPQAAPFSWNYIFQIAKEHKKALIYSHAIAILAMIANVPVPLFMPLLVDEILLHKPGLIIQR